ncbi:Tripartite tricarboxylate transporter family receptor [Pigmentiphaga humi]|uniref:Tripartite tricarboxylate transporter family receptor n=1 Tax=Pigmentiphaga humi TaxID=2478468 RepID=A0A3P4AY50_9BURK|nr:tripartite tricarboxylate transporter substrate binding protein [Pigmentiphaga humi]VCU68973.1 Tripartite tricarboxylate transporter family receptor [Pigmentiphaga humi]
MNRRIAIKTAAALAAASLLAPLSAAQAQAWPDKPVRLLLSQPPGSGPDNIARLLSDRLYARWNQPVIIENKPGGQNTVGAVAAARSPADGHNFYFATTAALVTNPFLFKQLPYDPAKDFVPVAFVARSPFGILVKADSPIRSVEELVAKSKAAPGTVTLGNEGPRTFGGMIARLFNSRSGAQANLVPYVSVGVSTQNLMGGHVDAIVADVASTAQLAKQGRLRLLAVTSDKRLADWPQVPALSEQLSDFDMVGWFAIVAPAGTPATAIERMNRDVNALLSDDDVAARIAAVGPIAAPGYSPEQTGAFLAREHARWAKITKEIDILPE